MSYILEPIVIIQEAVVPFFSGNIDFLINPVFFSDFQKRYTAHIEPHVRSSTP
jgi:hypothetical protein